MKGPLAISLIALILPLGAPAFAQQTDAERRAEAEKAREAAELRVQQDMVTMTSLVEAMAKTLGQLHYLRTLCFGLNDQRWRDQMSGMLSVEAPADTERQRALSRAFNAGFYQEQARHTVCDGGVSADVAALAENGRAVAAMLGDPYREVE
ncbi:MAG: TIGR02301 family protein [Litorimonas sp.]